MTTAVKTSLKDRIGIQFKLNLIASICTRSGLVQYVKCRRLILKDFTQVQKEEGKFVVVCPRPPLNVKLGGLARFHVVVVQWTSNKCTERRDARAVLLF